MLGICEFEVFGQLCRRLLVEKSLFERILTH